MVQHVSIVRCGADTFQRVAGGAGDHLDFRVSVPAVAELLPTISRHGTVPLLENPMGEDTADDIAGASGDPLRAYPFTLWVSVTGCAACGVRPWLCGSLLRARRAVRACSFEVFTWCRGAVVTAAFPSLGGEQNGSSASG